MLKQRLNWVIFGIFILLVLGLFFASLNLLQKELDASVIYMNSIYAARPKTMCLSGEKGCTQIEIDFGNGKKRLFESNLNQDVYPFPMALKAVAQEGRFTFNIRSNRIEEIAGIAGIWGIYQNGKKIQRPLEELIVSGGNKYTLRLE